MDWETRRSVDRAVDAYVQMWNASSRQQRILLLDEFWAEDGAYLDRRTSQKIEGLDNLAAYVERVRQDYPGHVFELVGPIDQHHGFFRINWALRGATSWIPLVGTDFGQVDDGGRINLVVRFHGHSDDRAQFGAV